MRLASPATRPAPRRPLARSSPSIAGRPENRGRAAPKLPERRAPTSPLAAGRQQRAVPAFARTDRAQFRIGGAQPGVRAVKRRLLARYHHLVLLVESFVDTVLRGLRVAGARAVPRHRLPRHWLDRTRFESRCIRARRGTVTKIVAGPNDSSPRNWSEYALRGLQAKPSTTI